MLFGKPYRLEWGVRDHSGYWMAREAPCQRSTLIAPEAPSPAVGGGDPLQGLSPAAPGFPAWEEGTSGRGRARAGPQGCSLGTEAEARATRDG